jgi:hypothetical protein
MLQCNKLVTFTLVLIFSGNIPNIEIKYWTKLKVNSNLAYNAIVLIAWVDLINIFWLKFTYLFVS